MCFIFYVLLESYLDSTISSDDKNLCLDGYKLLQRNTAVKNHSIKLSTRIPVCEINYDNKKIFIAALDQSLSQSIDEYDEFLRGFEGVIDYINQCNPYFTLIAGDFNDRCNRWWENGSNNTEGVSIGNLTSSYGLKQLIVKKNSYSSYFKSMH